ncbi:phosphoribosylanthranilate isomerase [Pedobacter sp. MC2016-24]|nr:phosphoribosylanthranilate isomerase [Pedobacter sp. MC2016-24]
MQAKLKICGMKVPENITEVAALEPDYLGFIFYKGSKRFVADLEPEFVKNLPAAIMKTGVFVNESLLEIVEMVNRYDLCAVQLHGEESPEFIEELKRHLGSHVEMIKAFGMEEGFDFSQLSTYQHLVDYFLFDTKTPAHGGSGQLFDWALLSQYELQVPYFLSGGIDLNSTEALKKINDTRLYALDINSRFELEPGLKDIDKLIDFKHRIKL